MSLQKTEENLKKAYCAVLACTGIGSATTHCEDLFPTVVWIVVPIAEQPDYPDRLSLCTHQICENEPYYWDVDDGLPVIGDDTTFEVLYSEWFKNIIS